MASTVSPLAPTVASKTRPFSDGTSIWHDAVPKKLAKHCRPHENGSAWTGWADHLAKRKRPRPLEELLDSKTWPLLWNVPDEIQHGSTADFVERLSPKATEKKGQKQKSKSKTGKRGGATDVEDLLREWLAESEHRDVVCGFALECLAVAHHLPAAAQSLDSQLWWSLLEMIVATAQEASEAQGSVSPAEQILAAELPLTLAYLFPEIVPCRKLARRGTESLSDGTTEPLDGDGTPHADHYPHFRTLFACWTRCLAMLPHIKDAKLARKAENSYEWSVRAMLLFSRSDGSQSLTDGAAGRLEADLFDAALRLAGDSEDRAAAKLALPRQKGAKKVRQYELPDCSRNSEWASIATLRSTWSRSADRLAIDYSKPNLRVELESSRTLLISGEVESELTVDGHLIGTDGTWEEVCWFSDDDLDYLELQLPLEGGWQIQRQFVLPREDGFLLIMDALQGKQDNVSIDYRLKLPLDPAINIAQPDDTSECVLNDGKKIVGLAMPLALPEWKIGPMRGALKREENGIELRQQAEGLNLGCPLFIDLRPKRFKRQFTWRQLTVAETRNIVAPEMAVGYRVQSGNEQWLFYRSLAEAANRTVLGQNFASEFFAGRFDTSGEADELVEIESD